MTAWLGLLVPTALLYWALAPAAAQRSPMLRLLHLGLAMGLAAGLTSCLWFVARAAFDVPLSRYCAVETALLMLLAWWRPRLPAPAPPPPAPRLPGATPMRFAMPVLALLVFTWLMSTAVEWILHPHGAWDAVAIWNLHAHYLVAGGARWSELSRQGARCAYHADYPLLVSAAVARLWNLSGATSPAVSGLLGAWFAAATVLLCSGAVGAVRGTNQALLTAVALLGGSFFVRQSGSQYADVPLAFYMLAAVAACVLHEATGRRAPGWLVVAGLCAGLAAWTKNEGVLFVVALIAVCTATSIRRAGWRTTRRDAAALAIGLLPVLCVVAYFKLAFAPVNDLAAGQGPQATLARLLDASRYPQIAIGLGRAIGRVAKLLLAVLPAYYLLMGATRVAAGRAAARFALSVFAVMLGGYCGVYVLTPQALTWHLNTSAPRLMLQLWPGTLMGVFLFLAAPEERLGGPS